MANKMNVKVGPLSGDESYALRELGAMLNLKDSEVLRYCLAVTFRAIVEGVNNERAKREAADDANGVIADEQSSTGVDDTSPAAAT